MNPRFTNQSNSEGDIKSHFNIFPRRIFLDTNVLQYLQDFGKYIFDNYKEEGEYFIGPKNIIGKNHPLYPEISALQNIFINIDHTNLEFALSESVYDEVVKKKSDPAFLRWFYEVWNNWQAVIKSYNDNAVSDGALEKYEKAKTDKSLQARLSKPDKLIVMDAIRLDCDALLTVDKFATYDNYRFMNKRYNLMILKPTVLYDVLKTPL